MLICTVPAPCAAQLIVLVPAVWPSVKPPIVATPWALLVAVPPVIVPPPAPPVQVTAVPATGLPFASRTRTDGIGDPLSAVPTAAVVGIPVPTVSWLAAPAVAVAVIDAGL